MDKHTPTAANTLMRVRHKGILCRKCNCIYPTLWSFRDHLIGPPCLGNWRIYATCNDCKDSFDEWRTLTEHYQQTTTAHTPVPSWYMGRIVPSSKDRPPRTLAAPSYTQHLAPTGIYWTYNNGPYTEYVYRTYPR